MMSIKKPNTENDLLNDTTIDNMKTSEALSLMIKNQSESIQVIKNNIDNIEKIVDAIFDHLNLSAKSRIIYAGAGTSARIGVQDGVELYPTFGWPVHRVDFLIAGGKEALLSSIAGAEDDQKSVLKMIESISLSKNDVVIALAASGNTPFTKKVLKESQKKRALTIAISNNPNGLVLNYANYKLTLDTGPEVISGSTRLKAGTAQKICLNMISSMLMIKLGRVKNGKMNFLVANNEKLKKRKAQIILSLKK